MICNLHEIDNNNEPYVFCRRLTPQGQHHMQELQTYIEKANFVTSLVKLLRNLRSILHGKLRL